MYIYKEDMPKVNQDDSVPINVSFKYTIGLLQYPLYSI